MLPLLLSVIVLPAWCNGRTGRGLWDQLPVHSGDQYYSQVTSRQQLPSNQYHTGTPVTYQYHSDRNTGTPDPYQYHSDSYARYKLPHHSSSQYYKNGGQLPSNAQNTNNRNNIQKRTLVVDDTDYSDDDKSQSAAGFWGQMVNKGAKDAHPRQSSVSKYMEKEANQNNKKLRSHRKQPKRKSSNQKKYERPVTTRNTHSLYDDKVGSDDEYDEYYDYEYYDDSKSESDTRVKNSKAHKAQVNQNEENAALRAHR